MASGTRSGAIYAVRDVGFIFRVNLVGDGLRGLGFGRLESTVDAGGVCKDLYCLANGRFLNVHHQRYDQKRT